jgi:hypothetical protein
MPEISGFITGFVGILIGLVVGISLLPVITSTIEDANLSGVTKILVGVMPTIVVVGLIMFAVKSLF